jgi:hypothetical protein
MQVGAKIPLYLQLSTYATDKYVRAVLRDANNNELSGSPVNLTHLGDGLYRYGSFTFPNSSFITVQYIIYTDSSYSTIDSNFQGLHELYIKNNKIPDGGNLPLYVQLYNYADDQYPQAILRDVNGNLIGSPIDLIHLEDGLYYNNSTTLSNYGFISIQYIVYSDAGHTTVSGGHGGSTNITFGPAAIPDVESIGWRPETRRIADAIKIAFGEPITYTPADSGSALSLRVPIDEVFEGVDPNTGVQVIQRSPIIGIKITDLPQAPQENDLVTMRGENFFVVKYETDGQAIYRVLLDKVSS